MKELSIEEKAKAYDKALKVLHKYDGAHIMFTQDLKEEMFPELREMSENEKIRKIISDILLIDSDEIREILDANNVLMQDVDDWLEKQSDQKSLDDVAKEITKNKETAMSFLKSCGIMNANGELADEYKIEQDEQNPTDNIEPKFNVGDIISNSISEVEIVSIENNYYNVTNGEIGNDANICNWVIYFKDQEKWKLVKYKSYNKENKEHFQLKQVFSKEDKYNYDIIQYILNNECVGKTDKENAIKWFKLLKDRYTWKPSERQISALEWQLKNTYKGSWQYIETKKLFEQLKRLIEE